MSDIVTYKTEERIDTKTVENFSKDLKALLDDGKYRLEVDMSDTVYISSVGLRVLLTTRRELDKNGGSLLIKHAGPAVRKVFEVTGFTRMFTLED